MGVFSELRISAIIILFFLTFPTYCGGMITGGVSVRSQALQCGGSVSKTTSIRAQDPSTTLLREQISTQARTEPIHILASCAIPYPSAHETR